MTITVTRQVIMLNEEPARFQVIEKTTDSINDTKSITRLDTLTLEEIDTKINDAHDLLDMWENIRDDAEALINE